jgi:hypothetical protein
MAVFGIGGRIDRVAAIRAPSQELDPRLYPTVRPFYLQNVVSGNFHIGTIFGLHHQSLATVLQYGSRHIQFDSTQGQFKNYRMTDPRFKCPFHGVTLPGFSLKKLKHLLQTIGWVLAKMTVP